jgi:hypothetical protein
LALIYVSILFWLCNLYPLNDILEFVLFRFRNADNVVFFCIVWLFYSNDWHLFFDIFLLYLGKWCKLFWLFVGLNFLLFVIIVVSKGFRRLLFIYFYKRFLRSIKYLLEARLLSRVSYLISLMFVLRLCQWLLYLWPLHNITLFLSTFMWIPGACGVNWLSIFFPMIISFINFYSSQSTLFSLLSFRFAWASGVNWFIIMLNWLISMLVRISTYS